MAAVNPYLNFSGNCEEAFHFYRAAFGGEFQTVMRFNEVPAEYQSSPEERNKIMHMALPIGQGTILMGSDKPASMGKVDFGDSASISIVTDSKEEADRIFHKLSEGGSVTMPLGDVFWGSYFGMLTDQYGIHWMVSYDSNQQ